MDGEQQTRRELLAAAGGSVLAFFGLPLFPAAGQGCQYAKIGLAKKPVGYWRLGEAAGPDAFDSSGNGHKGTYQGTPAFQERGAIAGDANTAVKLDGKNSYIEIADHKD